MFAISQNFAFPKFVIREHPKTFLSSLHFMFFVCLFVFFKKFMFFYLFIYLFMTVLSLRFRARAFSSSASGDHSSSRCTGLPPSWPLLLRSTGSRRAGSAIVAHRPSRSAACGIFPDQGSNPCPLHWQADSQPLRHQGSPILCFLTRAVICLL